MFKISWWVWIVVGACIGGTLLGYAYFQYYKPDTTEAAFLETYAGELDAEYKKDKRAQDRIDQAVADVESWAREWNAVVDAKMVNDDAFPDLSINPYQIVVSAPSYRNKVQRAVNRQVKSGGVTVIQGPTVISPGGEPGLMASYYNFGTGQIPFPVVIFELGTVTIRGSMSQIMANVESWSNMPDYFAVADGLAISGTDNELTANYNVVILAYLPGPATGPLGAATGMVSQDIQDLIDGFNNAAGGGGGTPPPAPGGGGGSRSDIPDNMGGRGAAGG